MRNSKAFTLVELIVIIVILGVIMVFSLPNITSTLERNKKDQMIVDAKDMVDKAKNYILSGKASYPTEGNSTTLILSQLDNRGEIKQSPFGNNYNSDSSKVIIKLDSGVYKYNVCLTDGMYILKTDSDISELNKDEKYTKIKKLEASC